jgi:hypothetical protein
VAAAAVDSAALRDSYLALSIQYARLAQILEKSASLTVGEIGPTDIRSQRRRQARSREPG